MSGSPTHDAMSTHLSEEALILEYYGESANRAVEEHLASCAACRAEFDRLRQVLSLVDSHPVPELPPDFERQVWARLAPALESRPPSWWSRVFPAGPRWALAGGVAALLLAAFVAGRFTGGEAPSAPPTPVTAAANDVAERVLVVAVVDHLDRSQMMLVELLNADPGATALDRTAEQSRARELVAENRLYRVSAEQAGDASVIDMLDDLERVLLEIANTPQNATPDELEALRQRIDARGLLFRVRVVHSEMRERERKTLTAGSTS